MNVAILRGSLSSEPRRTELASGSTVHNYEVTTGEPGGERVPVAWVDAPRPPKLVEGSEVVVVGTVRRRWFRSGGATQSRTEVLAVVVAKPESARVGKAVVAALERVARSGPFG